ncbi:hypothetical protein CW708_02255 [Candidatus Bathyarchaeota archaeon]|nr:MAG: hypothetical protein CW708_02255 [Candidatus Bathyarchaeota archaeon]
MKVKALNGIFVMLILLAIIIPNNVAKASNVETWQFFLGDYPGISITFNATQEVAPNENITIYLIVNCTAKGVTIQLLNLSIYGFEYGREKVYLLNPLTIIKNTRMVFNETIFNSTIVHVPENVWDRTYGELYIEYTIKDESFKRTPVFSATIVKNIYLEQLEDRLKELNSTYAYLNQTFLESFNMSLSPENLAKLNQTYWMLQQNYTSLQGNLNELDNTRRVATVLGITTAFFIATTLYLYFKKPKQSYW